MDMHHSGGRRRTGNLTALVGTTVCVLALAACGGGGSGEDQVRELAEQLANSDAAACDNFTKDFLEEQELTIKECEESAEQTDEGAEATVEEVSVEGDTATAVVLDEDRSTLKFVKQDDEWLLNGADVEEGAGKSGSAEQTAPEETETAPDTPAGGGEVEARAAVDALLMGVQDEDPQVLCGLLSESYAKELTGAREFGIAECVERLQGSSFGKIQKALKGVEVTGTKVTADGRSATVKLFNGDTVGLKYQEGRFVIDRL